MKVRDLLSKDSIEIGAMASNKKEAIEQAVALMMKRGNITDSQQYIQGVYAREEEGTTGIGEGIAIPHCKCDGVAAPGLAAMTIPEGVEFESLDGAPVKLLFLIAAPNTEDNVHLDVLSRLSVLLMDPDFSDALKAAKTSDEFLSIIDEAESQKENEEGQRSTEKSGSDVYVVAVTGCPTGIAHTYMAAEALEKAATSLGIEIKVETRGSGGAKNVLSDEEISRASGVIVASDTKVPMERFADKPVRECHVADGISKAEELVKEAAAGTAKPYIVKENVKEGQKDNASQNDSIGHQIYTHLMSGVSHMLPFVIGGGILVALAFLLDTLMGYGDAGSAFGTATPISAFLKYIGGLAMGLMVPVLAGYIAYSIADRPGLAVGFLGGLLASNGNAAIADYDWSNVGGFAKFVQDFAFVGDGSGNTVSGFLGGIAAGFLAGFVVLWLKKITEKMPKSLDGIRPILIYPVCGTFIVGVVMCFVLNPLIGVVNTGLSIMLTAVAASGMIWLLGLILGAMMAIDMGGPINKAAYVFGTGMLATAAELTAAGASTADPQVQACYISMAAIMAGGMVPPLGIALACIFFPNKFTEAERETKISNIVMACGFITEGAIPFAAADPAHVIPSTMVGAGVAGLLSALFGCTLMAPHGGVFVFATVGKPFLYIIAWLAGSVVTMIMLGILKKDVSKR
ncbi:MAG: fructose-specific PTS transporter subunit EIIC [Lachnospiraceae bacterium]|nr:fructose-specific PTS transporter subunit EIIC [Lachnospiraceae bacterium]